uniref:histidine kinase n=1 Tax=Chromera velia CCMP2878 TaxID=1169474 RepID=A0A0G4G5A2_9ALVE|eukprot:Cvel_20282.t1-p1 / transcript=Cvel_20282.t1 / gene=Cvel_20282 / organism=Chromera_velia_CCMP2878 / gene_product=Two-component response regulator ARR22, putative / transcript_product=Two-component response regulator ARR22, putative / location=Cvel_scaffold1810:4832-20235(-) / protein_length=1142 / sequence_SO=supercontig / SO=protein_coding / is_pseudo=false
MADIESSSAPLNPSNVPEIPRLSISRGCTRLLQAAKPREWGDDMTKFVQEQAELHKRDLKKIFIALEKKRLQQQSPNVAHGKRMTDTQAIKLTSPTVISRAAETPESSLTDRTGAVTNINQFSQARKWYPLVFLGYLAGIGILVFGGAFTPSAAILIILGTASVAPLCYFTQRKETVDANILLCLSAWMAATWITFSIGDPFHPVLKRAQGLCAYFFPLLFSILHLSEGVFMRLVAVNSTGYVVTAIVTDFGVGDANHIVSHVACLPVLLILNFGMRRLQTVNIDNLCTAIIEKEEATLAKRGFLSYIMHELRNPLSGARLIADEALAVLEEDAVWRYRSIRSSVLSSPSSALMDGSPSPLSGGDVVAASSLSPGLQGNEVPAPTVQVKLLPIVKALRDAISQMTHICNDVLNFERLGAGRFSFEFRKVDPLVWLRKCLCPEVQAFEAAGVEFVLSIRLGSSLNDCPAFASLRNLSTLLRSSSSTVHEGHGGLSGGGDLGVFAASAFTKLESGCFSGISLVMDELRLLQCLTNLTGNARKFTPKGGKVSLVISFEACCSPLRSRRGSRKGSSSREEERKTSLAENLVGGFRLGGPKSPSSGGDRDGEKRRSRSPRRRTSSLASVSAPPPHSPVRTRRASNTRSAPHTPPPPAFSNAALVPSDDASLIRAVITSPTNRAATSPSHGVGVFLDQGKQLPSTAGNKKWFSSDTHQEAHAEACIAALLASRENFMQASADHPAGDVRGEEEGMERIQPASGDMPPKSSRDKSVREREDKKSPSSSRVLEGSRSQSKLEGVEELSAPSVQMSQKREEELRPAEPFYSGGITWVRVMIEVRDTGCGLTKDEMSRLFKPYSQIRAGQTQKGGGTGLGLAISKGLVEGHLSGEIGVQSNSSPGIQTKGFNLSGSVFSFCFCSPLLPGLEDDDRDAWDDEEEGEPSSVPVPAGSGGEREKRQGEGDEVRTGGEVEMGAEEAVEEKSGREGKNETVEISAEKKVQPEEGNHGGSSAGSLQHEADVLIVDDDKMCRWGTSLCLSRLGYSHVEVADGDEAVKMFEEGKRFNLILIDRNMERMDGPDAVKEILRGLREKKPKIVGCTGETSAEGEQLFIEAGADLVIHKPVSSAKLAALFKDFQLSPIRRMRGGD